MTDDERMVEAKRKDAARAKQIGDNWTTDKNGNRVSLDGGDGPEFVDSESYPEDSKTASK